MIDTSCRLRHATTSGILEAYCLADEEAEATCNHTSLLSAMALDCIKVREAVIYVLAEFVR